MISAADAPWCSMSVTLGQAPMLASSRASVASDAKGSTCCRQDALPAVRSGGCMQARKLYHTTGSLSQHCRAAAHALVTKLLSVLLTCTM